MLFEELQKLILDKASVSLRKVAALNPLTIRQKGDYTKALFALGWVCILWGTTWIATKIGVNHMPPLQLAGLRQLLAGLIFVSFFVIKKAAFPRGKEWRSVIMLSILSFMLSNSLMVWGLSFIPAGIASIIGATFPLWLVVINMLTGAQKIPRLAVVGFALGFTGICIIFYEHFDAFLKPGFRAGITLSLAASWAWAVGTVITKKSAVAFNPYFSMGLQMLFSGMVTLLITYCVRVPGIQAVSLLTIPWQSWLAIVYLVLFGSIITFVAYLYALQRLPTTQMSVYGYINPIVAVILAAIVFSEPVTMFIITGGAVTLLGVYLINRAHKK